MEVEKIKYLIICESSEGDGEIWKPDLYRVSIKVVRGISVHVYRAGDLLSMPAYADIREMPARDFFSLRMSERTSERSCESEAKLIDSSH